MSADAYELDFDDDGDLFSEDEEDQASEVPCDVESVTNDEGSEKYHHFENNDVPRLKSISNNDKALEIELIYGTMKNIGIGLTSMHNTEFKKENAKKKPEPCVYIADNHDDEVAVMIDREIASLTYSFDKPIRCENMGRSSMFKLVKNASVTVDSVAQIACWDRLYENDLSRAYTFAGFHNTIFMLPGDPTFKLVPGLKYTFVTSTKVTRGGSNAQLHSPLPYQNKVGEMEVRFIVKKSLRWEPKVLTSRRMLDIFDYLLDLCMLKRVQKQMGKSVSDVLFTPPDFRDLVLDLSKDLLTTVTDISLLYHILAMRKVLQGFVDREKEGGKVTIWTRDALMEQVRETAIDSDRLYSSKPSGKTRVYQNKEQDSDTHGMGYGKGTYISFHNPTKKVNPLGEIFDHTSGTGLLLKKVLCHETLAKLYPYYSKLEVLRLSYKSLQTISQMIESTPCNLCFYFSYLPLLCDSSGLKVSNLKELTVRQLGNLYAAHNRPDDIGMRAVRIYTELKKAITLEGHKFLTLESLYRLSCHGQRKEFDEAVDFLIEYNAITKYQSPAPLHLEKLNEDCAEVQRRYQSGEKISASVDHPLADLAACCTKYTKTVSASSSSSDSSSSNPSSPISILVTLAHVRYAERTISKSLEKMFENYRKSPPLPFSAVVAEATGEPLLRPVAWSRSHIIPPQSFHPCSEQILARRVILSSEKLPTTPLTIIQGPGGSAKTSALKLVVDELKPNTFLVLTAQGANAAGCSEKVWHDAKTAHSILRAHADMCPKSPCFDQIAYNGAYKYKSPILEMEGAERKKAFLCASAQEKYDMLHPMECKGIRFKQKEKNFTTKKFHKGCFLKSIETLVIDEISLLDDEVFAVIVKVLVTCGYLKRIIVCGDYRQKPQISWGSLMDDLRFAFAWCIIEFNHCHRFDNGLMFTNAQAIYEGKAGQIEYAPECYGLVDLTDSGYTPYMKKQEKEEFHIALLKHFKILPTPDSIIITRSNEQKRFLSGLIRELGYGDRKSYNVLQKIFLTISDPDCNFVRKQLMVILRIEDVPLGKWMNKKSKATRSDLVQITSPPTTNVFSTNIPAKSTRSTFRRLIVCPLSTFSQGPLVYEKVGKQIIIPFFGPHERLVEDASVVTSHYMQGSEIPNVIVYQPTFWKVSDTSRVMFTSATRASKKLMFISTPEVMTQCIENAHPLRNSVAHEEMKAIALKHAHWLFHRHTERRRQLEAGGIVENNELYEHFQNKFQLNPFPTPKELFTPPFTDVLEKRKEENGKYDASEIVKKQRQQKNVANRKRKKKALENESKKRKEG